MSPLKKKSPIGDRPFSSNEAVWRALTQVNDRLLPNTIVHLHKFAVTEWLPRTPGLYHDPHAEEQRRYAESFRMPEASFLGRDDRPGRRIGLSRSDKGDLHPASVIYDPYGKSKMIEGGIGCVRLKDIHLPQGLTWFLGATSSEAVHEGVPIAVSDELYRKYISDIARGGFICDLTARLRCIPDHLDAMYRQSPHIPKIYFEIEEDFADVRLYDREGEPCKGDWVTGALGFRANQEGREQLLATFTSFINGDPLSLQEAVEWIEQIYVKDVFHGSVVTDFDQQSTRFAGAIFSIDSLFGNSVDVERARELVISIADPGVSEQIVRQMSRSAVKMEAYVKQTVTIGRGARVSDTQIALGGSTIAIDSRIGELADQLEAAIAKGSPSMPVREAKKLMKDGAALKNKLAAKKRNRSGIAKLLSSITGTAEAVGKAGRPILKLASMLAAAVHG
jgi:hypothetical protein